MTERTSAVLFMLASTLSFSIMEASVKHLTDVPLWQKVLVRNMVSLFVAYLIARRVRDPLWGRSSKGRVLLLIRALLGFGGVAFIFYATTRLDLADAALFMRLTPFWVTILAVIFLKERLTPVQIPALTLAFAGAILVMRPWERGGSVQLIPALAGLFASFLAAGAYTLVSNLKKYESPSTIVFTFSLVSILLAAPPAILSNYTPSLVELLYLLLIGVGAAGGQMFLTYAYHRAPAGEISIYNYTGIIFSGTLGYLIWGEIPTVWTFFGAIAIISAGFMIFLSGHKKDRRGA